MKQKTFLLLIGLGVIVVAYGVSKIEQTSSDLIACCNPATDTDCKPGNGNGDGGDNADSMPPQIIG